MDYQFHHIAISVSDLEKSSHWYKEMFGFEELGIFERKDLDVRFKHLKLGSLILEIFQSNNFQSLPEYRKELKDDLAVVGVKHFGIGVKDAQNAYLDLKGKGVEFTTELLTGASGMNYAFLKDPDGILIELSELR
ncbi:MAG: VOC family protein [Patescibacteria group bacterium]|nr:VOC family protein [Patescibacteria group bacterium]